MTRPEDLIALGHIAGAHGIRGEVLIKTYTGAPENVAAYGPLFDQTGARSFAVTIVRITPKGIVARIEGVANRDEAEALRATKLHVPRAALPAPADGEWYFEDLTGLAAVTRDGKCLGEIMAVQNYGAGDLLELRIIGRRDTVLIPFDEATVPEVDIKARSVTVVLPGEENEQEAPGKPSR